MSELEKNLLAAISNRKINDIKKCLEAGADINYQNALPLSNAVYSNQPEIVEFLLAQGARTDIPLSDGRTILQRAKSEGRDYITALIEKVELLRLAKETPEWSLFGASKLAHVEFSPVLERKLTEIFNFESRDRMVVCENLKTGAEKITPLESFDALPDETLRKVFLKFTGLGGKADEGMVFRRVILDKKPSPLKPE
jgi:ankyrin repeat protein